MPSGSIATSRTSPALRSRLADDGLLVADQDGIGACPTMSAPPAPARPVPPQRVDQVRPDQRKPVPAAYGRNADQKGRLGITLAIRTAIWRSTRKPAASTSRRLVGATLGSSRAQGDIQALMPMLEPDDRRDRHAHATASPSTRRPASCGHWCRSATGSATICLRLSDPGATRGGSYGWPTPNIGKHPQPGFATSPPTRWRRRSHPISCSKRTPRCSTRLLRGRSIPCRVQGQPSCGAEGLVEPLGADRLQGVRSAFKDGRPEGYYENLPPALALASSAPRSGAVRQDSPSPKDGSLLVADDTGERSGAIAYKGPSERAAAPVRNPKRPGGGPTALSREVLPAAGWRMRRAVLGTRGLWA